MVETQDIMYHVRGMWVWGVPGLRGECFEGGPDSSVYRWLYDNCLGLDPYNQDYQEFQNIEHEGCIPIACGTCWVYHFIEQCAVGCASWGQWCLDLLSEIRAERAFEMSHALAVIRRYATKYPLIPVVLQETAGRYRADVIADNPLVGGWPIEPNHPNNTMDYKNRAFLMFFLDGCLMGIRSFHSFRYLQTSAWLEGCPVVTESTYDDIVECNDPRGVLVNHEIRLPEGWEREWVE